MSGHDEDRAILERVETDLDRHVAMIAQEFREGFEAVDLIQTGKILHFPVVLFGTEHWRGLRSWIEEKLIAEKLIAEEDVLLLSLTDDPAEAVRIVLDCYERNCAHVIQDAEAAAT